MSVAVHACLSAALSLVTASTQEIASYLFLPFAEHHTIPKLLTMIATHIANRTRSPVMLSGFCRPPCSARLSGRVHGVRRRVSRGRGLFSC